jgi:RHS repeat-associated protein
MSRTRLHTSLALSLAHNMTRLALVVLVFVAAVGLIPHAAFAQPSEAVEYYGHDALGSVRVVFDATGTVTARADYGPFGEVFTQSGILPPGQFTGQERDGEAALDYFGARSYQPRTGRFTTVDPVYAGLFDPQQWNRYSYARNNPILFTDPAGTTCAYTQDWQNCGGGLTPDFFTRTEGRNPFVEDIVLWAWSQGGPGGRSPSFDFEVGTGYSGGFGDGHAPGTNQPSTPDAPQTPDQTVENNGPVIAVAVNIDLSLFGGVTASAGGIWDAQHGDLSSAPSDTFISTGTQVSFLYSIGASVSYSVFTSLGAMTHAATRTLTIPITAGLTLHYNFQGRLGNPVGMGVAIGPAFPSSGPSIARTDTAFSRTAPQRIPR